MRVKTTAKTEYQRHINVLVEYINSHLGEGIDLNKLVGISRFSRWHSRRVFTELLRGPVSTFIVRMRVETTARPLRHMEIPVKEIAYKVGYGIPSSLSEVFRQFYGISPNKYRNNKDYVIMEPNRIVPDIELKVGVKNLPGKQVTYIRLNRGYKKIDYPRTWICLFQFAREQSTQPLSFSLICLHHDDLKVASPGKLRTGICMKVAPVVCPGGGTGMKKIPEGRFMVVLYKGAHQQSGTVYNTLYGKYLPEIGLSLRKMPSDEIYLSDPRSMKPEGPLAQIYVAIE